MTPAAVWILLALAPGPDVETILERARRAYEAIRTAEIRGTTELVVSAAGFEQRTRSEVLIALRMPGSFRVEQKGPVGTLIVSDGTQIWNYYPAEKQYTHDRMPILFSTIARWGAFLVPSYPSAIKSASVVGEERLTVDGAVRPCYIIEVEQPSGRVRRRLWIDEENYLVRRSAALRHSDNYSASGQPAEYADIVTAESMTINGPVPDAAFTFEAPTEARLRERPGPAPLGTAAPLPPGVFRVGGAVSAPVPVYRGEPEYTEEARRAHVQGTVVLSMVVSEDGTPRDIRVLRPLGSGLDEKAIESVSRWRFRPAMKAGVPVPVQATVEVNFRTLDTPPPAR